MDYSEAWAAFLGASAAFGLGWLREAYARWKVEKRTLREYQSRIGLQIQRCDALYNTFLRPHEKVTPGKRHFFVPPMVMDLSPSGVDIDGIGFIIEGSWQRRSGERFSDVINRLQLSQWTYENVASIVRERSRVHVAFQHRVTELELPMPQPFGVLNAIEPYATQLRDTTEGLYEECPRALKQLRGVFDSLGSILLNVYHERPVYFSGDMKPPAPLLRGGIDIAPETSEATARNGPV